MRIAVFTDCFFPSINGVVISVANSSLLLAKKGHKVMIFTASSSKKPPFIHKNVSIAYYKQFNLFNLLKYPDFHFAFPNLSVFWKLRDFKPDIIHVHMPTPLGVFALACSKILKLPVIGTYHTIFPEFLEHSNVPKSFAKSSFAKNLMWDYSIKFYNRCNIVITPSDSLKKELLRRGIKKPIKVISNGVDINKFKPSKSKKSGTKIIHVGRLSYEKRIDVVIKAFMLVAKKDLNAVLFIVGRGPEESALKKLAGNYLNQRIVFLGYVEHDKLPKIYSSADIFVTASPIETEGLVVLEAMACGLPIVGIKAGALPDIVKQEFNGYMAKPGNYQELASYISVLLKNRRLREKLGENSLKLSKKFSLESNVDVLEKLYFSLVKS